MWYDPHTPVPGNAPRSGVHAADEKSRLAKLPKSYPSPLEMASRILEASPISKVTLQPERDLLLRPSPKLPPRPQSLPDARRPGSLQDSTLPPPAHEVAPMGESPGHAVPVHRSPSTRTPGEDPERIRRAPASPPLMRHHRALESRGGRAHGVSDGFWY